MASKKGDPNKPLTLREQELVNLYTTPGATYLNGLQSVKASNGHAVTNDNSAGAVASRVLNTARVANAVKDRLEQQGMGSDVRLDMTATIAAGYTETITTTVEGEGRKPVTTTTRRPLSPKVRLQAMQRLDKLDGSEDERRVQADVMSAGMRALSRRMLKEASTTSEHVLESRPVGTGSGDGLGGEGAPGSTSILTPPDEPDTEFPGGGLPLIAEGWAYAKE